MYPIHIERKIGMRKISILLGSMLVVTFMTACGGGGGKYSSPTNTMKTLQAASEAGDADGVTACFDKKFQEQMKGAKKNTNGPAETFKEAVFGKEVITGDKATLEVTVDGKTQTLPFINEDGEWKIDFSSFMQAMIKGMTDAMKNMGQ